MLTIKEIEELIHSHLEDYDCYCRDADCCKEYPETNKMVSEIAVKIFEKLN